MSELQDGSAGCSYVVEDNVSSEATKGAFAVPFQVLAKRGRSSQPSQPGQASSSSSAAPITVSRWSKRSSESTAQQPPKGGKGGNGGDGDGGGDPSGGSGDPTPPPPPSENMLAWREYVLKLSHQALVVFYPVRSSLLSEIYTGGDWQEALGVFSSMCAASGCQSLHFVKCLQHLCLNDSSMKPPGLVNPSDFQHHTSAFTPTYSVLV